MFKTGKTPLIADVLFVGITVALISGLAIWAQDLYINSIKESEASLSQLKIETRFQWELVSAKITENEGSKTVTATVKNNAEYTINEFIIFGYKADERILINNALPGNILPYEQSDISFIHNHENIDYYELVPKINGNAMQSKSIQFVPS